MKSFSYICIVGVKGERSSPTEIEINSQVAIRCHSYIGGCITLPVMGSTGSNPVLTTQKTNKMEFLYPVRDEF